MKIYFWGVLAEKTGVRETDVSPAKNLEALNSLLRKNYPGLLSCEYKFGVNGILGTEPIELKKDDRIDVFPPFAGG